MLRLTSLTAAAVVAILPSTARAQFEAVSKFLERTSGIAIYADVGFPTHQDHLTGDEFLFFDSALRGFGLEVLFDLDKVGSWPFELGLGYSQTTGFEATAPSIDLRGSFRSLPTIAGYGQMPVDLGNFGLYLGIMTGFVKLAGVEAYDSMGRQFSIEGDTFEFGISAGIFHAAGVFLEFGYRDRDFRSIEFEFPEGVETVPNEWPRSLNLSAAFISLGFQTRGLRKPKKGDPEAGEEGET